MQYRLKNPQRFYSCFNLCSGILSDSTLYHSFREDHPRSSYLVHQHGGCFLFSFVISKVMTSHENTKSVSTICHFSRISLRLGYIWFHFLHFITFLQIVEVLRHFVKLLTVSYLNTQPSNIQMATKCHLVQGISKSIGLNRYVCYVWAYDLNTRTPAQHSWLPN